MARLEYSNLPPEAQQAIQKLTGCTHEELNSENSKQPDTTSTTTKKKQPKSLKKIFWLAFLSGWKRRGKSYR